MSTPVQAKDTLTASVRPVKEADLMEARRIFRVAFGTFMKVPDPETFSADREYIVTRWRTDPSSALAADIDGQLAGTNFAANWGSFGFFGPLTIRPELWDRRIAQALLGPTVDLFDNWGVRDAGLFTFSNSPKHLGLYQKFGFWARFLTAIMSKRVNACETSALKYSALSEADRTSALKACRELTDSIYEGLDVSIEIRSVLEQSLGDTLLVWGGDTLDALAICHCGEGTEAGRDTCYVKFAAVRPGPHAEKKFDALLNACEALAAERGLTRLEAGVNLGRSQAYRHMLSRGFRTDFQGVAMHRPDAPAYNRSDVFAIDDWR
jgi:GNAT superfamily N-acetyltransferase